jgi:6,7-dimethyl-8-ribityllumazine synthase
MFVIASRALGETWQSSLPGVIVRSAIENQPKYSASGMRLGIVVSRFNVDITSRLLESAKQTLLAAGASDAHVHIVHVPGAFEIPVAAQALALSGNVEGVMTLGCVIRGETTHYEHICTTCAQGVSRVALEARLPVIFGVLTAENREQAEARSGGAHGDIGAEGAQSLIEMVHVMKGVQASQY